MKNRTLVITGIDKDKSDEDNAFVTISTETQVEPHDLLWVGENLWVYVISEKDGLFHLRTPVGSKANIIEVVVDLIANKTVVAVPEIGKVKGSFNPKTGETYE